MIYHLSDKGRREMPSNWMPFYYILDGGAKTFDGILSGLKDHVDVYSVSKDIERGFGNVDEVGRWIHSLVKKGYVNEVPQL